MELENLYTYAFLEIPSFPLILPQGTTSQVVLINGTKKLAAIVESGISLESFQNNDEKIIQMALSHDRVIREIFQQTTVLPLRFGTYFASKNNLLTHLKSHGEEYESKLEKINHKMEVILKLIPRKMKEPLPLEGGGKSYFLAKKQRYEDQNNFSISQATEKQNIIDFIAKSNQFPFVIKEKDEEVRIYFLVNYQYKNSLLEQFLDWQNVCQYWDLSLEDFLPPYHFIE